MIELNADVGEGYDDASLMPYLARVSIACGGHAGDAVSMEAALRLAAKYGVAVGATQAIRTACSSAGARSMHPGRRWCPG